MFDYQKKCVSDFQNNRFNIILKARQLGLSTTVAMYALWLMLFKEGTKVAIVANKRDTAQELLDKIKIMWEALPQWLGGPTAQQVKQNKVRNAAKTYNVNEFEMMNMSKAQSFSSSSDATRSISATLLIFDEAAFIENCAEVYGGAQSTVTSSENSRIILLSTPGASFGFFYEKWNEAIEGRNDFHPIELSWKVHPERDIKWRTQEDRLAGKKKAARENDLKFDVTGDTVIDSDNLEYIEKNYVIPPTEKRGDKKDYWIWDYPTPGATFFSVIDCARGDGEDTSTISIIDAKTFELAAEYQGDATPKLLAKLAVQTAIEYNNSLIIVERTGEAGGATINELSHYDYSNIFRTPNDTSTTDFNSFLKSAGMNEDDMKVGVSTNVATRPIWISKFLSYIDLLVDDSTPPFNKPNIIKSSRLIRECKAFIYKNGKAQAAKGQHDDLVIPRAIACGLRDTVFTFQEKLNNMIRATMSYSQVTRPYQNYQLPSSRNIVDNNSYRVNVPNGRGGFNNEDMSWLRDA